MLAELALLCLLAGGPPEPVAAIAAPDADPALSLAESLLASGAPAQAVTEYKRFLFFHPRDSREAEVRFRLGFCLLAEGRFQEGMAVLRQAAALQPGLELRLEVVRALLQAGRLAEAELELLGLEAFSGGSQSDISLHLGLLRIQQGRWDEAGEALLGSFPEGDLQFLRELLAEAGRQKRKSPRTARLLSALLPGAGQTYAGDPADGLNALAVNGGLAVLAAAAAVNRYYPEAVLLVLFPLRRYYTGNIGNAGRLAEERNAAAEREYRRRIMDALERLQNGE